MSATARITARQYNFPIAAGGWNANDALDAMKPDEAETLINWIPRTTYLELRGGYTEHCDTGSGKAVTAVATYASGSADKLLAYTDGEWFDVTTSTPASLATVGTNGYWDYVNFATAAGSYLIAVNGDATPQVYDGATMVDAVNTVGGVASTLDFSNVCSFQQRLYLAEKDSLSFWYLPVGQYQGALTEFDLGPLAVQGGAIAAIETWTRDNASAGANEMFVAVTTEGEVFIYTGLYPGGVWNLAARFVVGKPVSGPNCLTRIGPDLVLMCEDGFQPLGQYLQLGQSQAQRVALSKKIGNAVTQAVDLYKAEPGWDAVLYPAGNALWFNVPKTGGVFDQFAVNTLTGAWTRLTGQNGYAWAIYNSRPYFGAGDGVVYQADSGTSDNGAAITAEYRGSYQYVGGSALIKQVKMAKPVFQADGAPILSFGVDVDFNNTTLTAPVTTIATGATWGSGTWGSSVWASGMTLQAPWISVGVLGYALAPHFIISSGTIQCRLMSVSLLYERGAYI